MKAGPFGAREPWEPSRMRTGPDVTVQDVLDVLVGRTSAPSNMGAQLERIQDAAFRISDRMQAMNLIDLDQDSLELPMRTAKRQVANPSCVDAAEQFAFMRAPAIHCLQDLCAVKHTHVLKSRAAIAALHKRAPDWTQGAIVVGCLRAYQERASKSKERGLAEVHAWSQRITGAEPDDDACELAEQFAKGKALRKRRAAAELYADCMLVVMGWVGIWNRRHK